MTCAEANQIALVDYLYSSGIQPHKIRNDDYWYLLRLKDEKTPLFNVNRKLNAWYDCGLGQGGNIIDFALLYHRCTVSELLKKIPEILSFHQPQTTVQQPPPNTQNRKLEALEPTIKVIAAKPLTHPSLCRYLSERKIPFEIVKKFCKEVEFELKGKQFFAIKLENKSGGFELQNKLFKGSTSPKDVTQISVYNSKNVAVLECFSFPSYQILHIKKARADKFSYPKLPFFFRKEPVDYGRSPED